MKKKPMKFLRVTAEQFHDLGLEKDLRASVCSLLRACDIPHSITDAGMIVDEQMSRRRAVWTDGWPDVTACLPGGRFLGIETKTAKGKLRLSQISCHYELRKAGAIVIVPRSLEDVAQALLDAGVEHEVLFRLVRRKKA